MELGEFIFLTDAESLTIPNTGSWVVHWEAELADSINVYLDMGHGVQIEELVAPDVKILEYPLAPHHLHICDPLLDAYVPEAHVVHTVIPVVLNDE